MNNNHSEKYLESTKKDLFDSFNETKEVLNEDKSGSPIRRIWFHLVFLTKIYSSQLIQKNYLLQITKYQQTLMKMK